MIVYIRYHPLGYWLGVILLSLCGNVISMKFYCNVFKDVTALFVCGWGKEQESNEITVGQPNWSSFNQTVYFFFSSFASFEWKKKKRILIWIVCVYVWSLKMARGTIYNFTFSLFIWNTASLMPERYTGFVGDILVLVFRPIRMHEKSA